MQQFFRPNNRRIQPAQQEGVVDTYFDPTIIGYVPIPNASAVDSTLTVSAAPVSTLSTLTVVVNPAYGPFIGANTVVATFTTTASATPATAAIQAAQALSANLLFSAYFKVSVSGTDITIAPKQSYDAAASLVSAAATGITAAAAIGAASVTLPSISVGRLVYTADGDDERSIRAVSAGATGRLRGFTMWCPDVPYSVAKSQLNLTNFWMHDVLAAGCINLNTVAQFNASADTSAADIHVYVVGPNQGRIRFSADAGFTVLLSSLTGLRNVADFNLRILEYGANSFVKAKVSI